MKSRSTIRKKKKRQSIVLNSLIGIVFALILVIGASLLFQDDSAAEKGGANESSSSASVAEDGHADRKSETASADLTKREDEPKQKAKEQEPDQDREQEKREKPKIHEVEQDKDKDKQDKPKQEKSQAKIGEPIGTSQTGEHTSSYVEGSADWNEKIKAIQMVTGLDDSMILWRLENDGDPQKSVGKVSPGDEQDWMYVVKLQWVDQEGWKVTDMTKQNR